MSRTGSRRVSEPSRHASGVPGWPLRLVGVTRLRRLRAMVAGRRGGFGGPAPTHLSRYSFTARKRSALPITLTEESDIAAAAMIGDNSNPKKG